MIVAHISRLARRSRIGSTTLLAGALAGLLMSAHTLRAEEIRRPRPVEVWVCSDHRTDDGRRPPIEFTLQDGLLIEQPLGSPRYRLLADNAFALIGVDHFADFEPVLGTVNIFVSTLTIDRASGNFAMAMTTAGNVLEPRTGRCRMFEEHAASGGLLAQRR